MKGFLSEDDYSASYPLVPPPRPPPRVYQDVEYSGALSSASTSHYPTDDEWSERTSLAETHFSYDPQTDTDGDRTPELRSDLSTYTMEQLVSAAEELRRRDLAAKRPPPGPPKRFNEIKERPVPSIAMESRTMSRPTSPVIPVQLNHPPRSGTSMGFYDKDYETNRSQSYSKPRRRRSPIPKPVYVQDQGSGSKCPHCKIHSWLPHSPNCPRLLKKKR